MKIKARIPGTCGELVQGRIKGKNLELKIAKRIFCFLSVLVVSVAGHASDEEPFEIDAEVSAGYDDNINFESGDFSKEGFFTRVAPTMTVEGEKKGFSYEIKGAAGYEVFPTEQKFNNFLN